MKEISNHLSEMVWDRSMNYMPAVTDMDGLLNRYRMENLLEMSFDFGAKKVRTESLRCRH